MPRIVSVNVGRPRQISVRRGRPLMSAIDKAPVEGRVRVEGVNLAGDEQADRRVHGGPDKAVYAYASEDAAWWAAELDREIPPGMFGENLTTEGIDVSGAVIGERWRVGTRRARGVPAAAAVREARHALRRSARWCGSSARPAGRAPTCGSSARASWAPATRSSCSRGPTHGITVALVSDAILLDESLRARAGSAPELAESLAVHLRQAA